MGKQASEGARGPADAARRDYAKIAASEEFRRLVEAKKRFIWPCMAFFVVYYFALPVLVGYFPSLMERRVAGAINIAYLFALSQFFMAWGVMALYIWRARDFDRMEREFIARVRAGTL
jgi:uncharacterized membrane protein (DUF485 family)